MGTERLDVRLDSEHRRKLKELAAEQGVPVSEAVRRLIDLAYKESVQSRRREAARSLAQMEIEDVPDPETLSRQLESAYESNGLH